MHLSELKPDSYIFLPEKENLKRYRILNSKSSAGEKITVLIKFKNITINLLAQLQYKNGNFSQKLAELVGMSVACILTLTTVTLIRSP